MTAPNLLMNRKIVPTRGGLRLLVPVMILAGLAMAPAPVQAAPAASPQSQAVQAPKTAVSPAAAKEPETTGSLQPAANGDVACARSRKRLFVEGEGWIVRRVTTCY